MADLDDPQFAMPIAGRKKRPARPSREGKAGIVFYVPKALHKAVMKHAIDLDTTLQDYMVQMLVKNLANEGVTIVATE